MDSRWRRHNSLSRPRLGEIVGGDRIRSCSLSEIASKRARGMNESDIVMRDIVSETRPRMTETAAEQVDRAAVAKASRSASEKLNLRPKYDFDPDTLDCTICMEPLSSPVFQCENGHIACSSCCKKLVKGCPSCSKPIGTIRNLALEKVLEALQMSCKHFNHGCVEMPRFTKKKEHESSCRFTPIHCPNPSCNYSGPSHSFPAHFETEHRIPTLEADALNKLSCTVRPTYSFVMFKADHKLFLLHHEKESLGDVFYVTALGTPADDHHYSIQISIGKDHNCYVLDIAAKSILHDEEQRKDFLLIPKQSVVPMRGHFHVDLWLRRILDV